MLGFGTTPYHNEKALGPWRPDQKKEMSRVRWISIEGEKRNKIENEATDEDGAEGSAPIR